MCLTPSPIRMDEPTMRAAVYGGAFLGGGGGGGLRGGLKTMQDVLSCGKPLMLLPIEALPEDALLATASMVGAPAAKNGYADNDQVRRTMELYTGRGLPVQGIITCENGGGSTANGWLLSALTGIPLVDAPCNGRAHPTGQMGSMGLGQVPGFVSVQAAAGGNPALGLATELCAAGPMDVVSHLVRLAADEAGGLVAVLRNGVQAGYVKKHGAPGAIRQAIGVGKVFLQHEGSGEEILKGLSSLFTLSVLAQGCVEGYTLTTRGGYDVGSLTVDGCELTFWNEYMCAEKNGKRLATFPDLMVTLDRETGEVLSSAQIQNGRQVTVVSVPRSELILGEGMREETSFREAEKIIGKSLW